MIRGYPAAEVRAAEEPALAAGEPLMSRAAEAVADRVRALLAGTAATGERPPVLVLVGGGNNGGDGLLAAAALAPDADVTVAQVRPEVHAVGMAAVRAAGVEVLDLATGGSTERLTETASRAHVWVDALAGIGISGPLRDPARGVVRLLSELREQGPVDPLVVAVDVPSGVDADTGAAGGPVLTADVTVTFGGVKAGLLLPPGARAAGAVEHVGIGLEEAFGARAHTVERLADADVRDLWPVPGDDDHKYSRGVVGVVAGSDVYPGAAVLATSAAVRTGVGMVRYVGPAHAADRVVAAHPEVVAGRGRVQAWVVGSGVDGDEQRDAATTAIADALRDRLPLVVDAGALSLLPDAERLADRRVLLTPHAGELATLLAGRGEDVDRSGVEGDPGRWVRRAAQVTGATVLLKGPVTLVAAARGPLLSQQDGTGWLATAGAGDVLAGVLGALLAQLDDAVPLTRAAALGALVHGRAARRASGGGPIAASDVAAALPATIRELLTGGGT